MSGPKHLWSGDWERESAAHRRAEATPQPEPAAPAAEPAPTPVRARSAAELRRRRRLRRAAPVVLLAVALVAAGAYGLSSLLGSSGSPAPAFANGGSPSLPVTSPAGASPTVRWLGMQIVTVPPGAAMVATAPPGSAGEQAGIEPGDEILAINGHSIGGAGDIAAAIQGLHAGDQVQLQASHGSALYGAVVTLAAPPSVQP
jgi:membrane-associated protease RseP (regulator of RpoE activity)